MSHLPPSYLRDGHQYRGVQDIDYVTSGLESRTASMIVKDMTRKPEIIDRQMITRSVYNKIIEYGIISCQITRTYGLVIYALSELGKQIDLDNDKDEIIIQQIMRLFYQDSNLIASLPLYAGLVDPEKLAYLRKALTFSYLNQLNPRNYSPIDDYGPCFDEDNTYFNTIHTFAIIKKMPEFEGPIHYFNIVKSQTLGEICCYSSWGTDDIEVQWSRFPINYDQLSNIETLIRLMIKPDDVIKPTLNKEQIVERYIGNLLNSEELYVIEILNEDSNPLVDTVKDVLRPGFLRSGGSIKNKKRKSHNRKSNKKRTKKMKKTKRVRKTYKKR